MYQIGALIDFSITAFACGVVAILVPYGIYKARLAQLRAELRK